MSWNDGYERKKFKTEQAREEAKYRKCGMEEWKIKEMAAYDRLVFNSERRFRTHMEDLEKNVKNIKEIDNSARMSALLQAYGVSVTVTIDDCEGYSRYYWIETIEHPVLAARLKQLTTDELELITLYYLEGYTQKEIEEQMGSTQQKISEKLIKIKNFLRKGV